MEIIKEVNEVTDKMTKEKEVENIDGNLTETTTKEVKKKKTFSEANLDNNITDDFQLLSSYTNDGYTRVTKVLNVYGGCIVNTYTVNADTNVHVTSVFVPGNHLLNGKITKM